MEKGRSRKKHKKNPIIIIVVILLLGAMIFAGVKIASILLDYKKGDDYNESVVSVAGISTIQIEAGGHNITLKQIDFDALKSINSDVIGWIELPDSKIDNPVVKSKDNIDYLHMDLNGEYSSYGTIFADYRVPTDFSEDLEILYGHHMKSGAMFAGLEDFKKQEYYDEHPFFIFYTPDANYLLEPYAGITIGGNEDIYLECRTKEDYKAFMDRAIAGSPFKSNIEMDENQKTMALYTCTYTGTDARYIVLCKMTKL